MNRPLLNIDIGERGADHAPDHALLRHADIVNIACGGHAGCPESVARFRDLAQERRLTITAHLSYPDREHFGRRSLKMPFSELSQSLDAQRALLPDTQAVKLHGALYNDCAAEPALAEPMSAWLAASGFTTVITLPHSELDRACRRHGLRVWSEAFAERRYTLTPATGQLTLTSRQQPHACITDLESALEHVRTLIQRRQVWATVAGVDDRSETRLVPVDADTLCIHSDSPIALELAAAIRAWWPTASPPEKRSPPCAS